jgi:hypothetical protein
LALELGKIRRRRLRRSDNKTLRASERENMQPSTQRQHMMSESSEMLNWLGLKM